ncbi:hypothetical protein [Caulobacter sp. 1776]|uniref:hypothetical protein n=1 Tax=Caulobacter sp. 1776 TaxID=3156420 RepID=UPI003395BE1A
MTPLKPAPTTAMIGAGEPLMAKLYKFTGILCAIASSKTSAFQDMRAPQAPYD